MLNYTAKHWKEIHMSLHSMKSVSAEFYGKIIVFYMVRMFYTVYWVHPGFLSLWQIQQSFLRYVGVAEATQWLPSGHDEDQSCRAGQVGTMRSIWAPEQAAGPSSAGFMQHYLQSLIHQVDGREEARLPDVIGPQRDLQLPQNFCRLLNPPAKLLQEKVFL